MILNMIDLIGEIAVEYKRSLLGGNEFIDNLNTIFNISVHFSV